jgi:hypothetical protein
MKPHRRRPQPSAEALIAKYRNEPWFVTVGLEDRGNGLVLYVRSGCQFKTHRDCEGHPVRVVKSVVRRPGSAA